MHRYCQLKITNKSKNAHFTYQTVILTLLLVTFINITPITWSYPALKPFILSFCYLIKNNILLLPLKLT